MFFMNTSATTLALEATGFFSPLVSDYISGDEKLKPFYQHPVSIEGIKSSIEQRRHFNTNRALLVYKLNEKYSSVSLTEKQQLNINSLLSENTFTITTAHQPNIFTGHLYFIFKILHAIKLAAFLDEQIPENKFVPVYYMGSEDADLDELGQIFINGEKYEWKTEQTGAVGRMKVDKALVKLIDMFSGQLLVQPFGEKIIDLMRRCYALGTTIEMATFQLVNELFAQYGLLILLPDDADLKRQFAPVMERELLEQFSHTEVAASMQHFPTEYKVQASGRDLNLFYLQEQSRARIEKLDDHFEVVDSPIKFSETEIMDELKNHPESFSPNVILRPVLQESILPNVAFIGGGGEIAYWLELKKVFEAAGVPYPVLVVRNSFLIAEKKYDELVKKLDFSYKELFSSSFDLMGKLVKRDSALQTDLAKEKAAFVILYNKVKSAASRIDSTLQAHTEALCVKSIKKIEALEKKMLKAEKKKFAAQEAQLKKVKVQLFPSNSLQERVENFMGLYSKFGDDFIQSLYLHSLTLEQEFTVLVEK